MENLEEAQREMRERQQRSSHTIDPASDVTASEIAERREKMRELRKKVERQVGGSRKSVAAAVPALEWLGRVISEKDFSTDEKFRAAQLLLDYAIADGHVAALKKKAVGSLMGAERDAANAVAKKIRAEVVHKKMSNREIVLRARQAVKGLEGKADNGTDNNGVAEQVEA